MGQAGREGGLAQANTIQGEVVQPSDDAEEVRPEGEAVAEEHPLDASKRKGKE